MMGVPGSRDADPSLLVAILAPLMFGFMFGDVVQGAVVAVAGLRVRQAHAGAAPADPGRPRRHLLRLRLRQRVRARRPDRAAVAAPAQRAAAGTDRGARLRRRDDPDRAGRRCVAARLARRIPALAALRCGPAVRLPRHRGHRARRRVRCGRCRSASPGRSRAQPSPARRRAWGPRHRQPARASSASCSCR